MAVPTDTEVRLRLYRDFIESGHPPSSARLAALLEAPLEAIQAAFERLAAGKAIVLQPSSREVLMANPLCAVPSPFLAHAGGHAFFGSCVWDALGIVAMLPSGGTVETSCSCCGERMSIEIRDGHPQPAEGIVHFAIPAKRWWENIVFT